jgi:rhamnogalacturonyl hydrolase YesR
MTADCSLTVVAYLKYYPVIYLKELKNIRKTSPRIIRSQVEDLNMRPLQHEAGYWSFDYDALLQNYIEVSASTLSMLAFFIGRNFLMIGVVNVHDNI